MLLDEMFPTNTLKAEDLERGDATAVIARIEMEKFDEGPKPVLYFQNTEKRLILNKINANSIADIYGKDTAQWIGQPITMGMDWTDYQGRRTKCIRIRPQMIQPQAPAATPAAPAGFTPAAPPSAPTTVADPSQDVLNDEVPF